MSARAFLSPARCNFSHLSLHTGSATTKLTYYLLLALVERHPGVRFHKDLDQDYTVVVSSADRLHKPRRSQRPFINQIRELGNIDARRAGGGRRDGDVVAHRGGGKPTVSSD